MLGRIEKGKLIIELRVQEPTLSSSGKTLVVATSRGPRRSKAKVDGKPVYVTANAYIQPEKTVHGANKTQKEETRRKAPLKKHKAK
jgi:hypothetical protein